MRDNISLVSKTQQQIQIIHTYKNNVTINPHTGKHGQNLDPLYK